jgi:aromatic-L-amino-acid decarboxylase
MDLGAEAMRRLGYRLVDRVVERWDNLAASPVARLADREEMERRLHEPLPWHGEDIEHVLERFWRDVEPYAGKIDHPRFFAFIPSSPTFASVLGDWLATGCNFFQGTWIESAGPSQIELVVLDWLRDGLGFAAGTGGLLTSGGSVANLLGLAVARHARLDDELSRGTAYTSDQTHSAVSRAFRVLGFPDQNLRSLPSDVEWRLCPASLEDAVHADRAAGLQPFCVIATAGTTNTGAVDPLDAIADYCDREGLWLHVDGAYGAIARISPTQAPRLEGLERADSLVLDPHKWLYVGYEAGCLLVRDVQALEATFSVLPDYLQDTDVHTGEVNFGNRGVQLSRAARGIKLWLSLKTHGFTAMVREIDRTVQLAEHAERQIRAHATLEVVAPASMGIVCFRHRPPGLEGAEALNAHNEQIVRKIQSEGRFMISSTRLDGRYAIRLCPMNYRTSASDVDALLDEVRAVASRLG